MQVVTTTYVAFLHLLWTPSGAGKAEHTVMIMKFMRVETIWEYDLKQTADSVKIQ